ncbi:HdeD family acid-resistance protein [Halovivax cerinus]|uniref:HdeD family acid-resistance protein n=1 Tax=Halovivax cerinus TaxID=1487865 RepID=A0ABD5NK00_9EURY|nr:DUF308 domain-containing protein [Halovivax cerinus]
MSTITPRGAETIGTNWRPLAVTGGLVGILGVLAIALPFGTGIAIAYIVGAALLVAGLVHAGQAIAADGWTGSLWQVLLAVVTAVAGILILANPLLGLVSLTLLAIAYLLVDGIAELLASVRMESGTGRGWIAASGALSLVLAGFLWVGFPADALWLVGFAIGVSLVMTGVSMIAIAFSVRGMEGEFSAPSDTSRGV